MRKGQTINKLEGKICLVGHERQVVMDKKDTTKGPTTLVSFSRLLQHTKSPSSFSVCTIFIMPKTFTDIHRHLRTPTTDTRDIMQDSSSSAAVLRANTSITNTNTNNKRGRPLEEEHDAVAAKPKPMLPSCLLGATPEITSTTLRGSNNSKQGGGGGAGVLGEEVLLVVETDPHRLAQRQKQIDYGKNTLGYDRYVQVVPRERRRRADPSTPDIHAKISTKRFNGLVRAWRRRLHEYDPQEATTAGGQGQYHQTPSGKKAVEELEGAGGAEGRRDGNEEEEIINTQAGGPSSIGKGHDKKKSRVNPYEDNDNGEEARAQELAGQEAEGKAEMVVEANLAMKMSAAASIGTAPNVAFEDKEVCYYSDDDLL